jgi:hypothetical protein
MMRKRLVAVTALLSALAAGAPIAGASASTPIGPLPPIRWTGQQFTPPPAGSFTLPAFGPLGPLSIQFTTPAVGPIVVDIGAIIINGKLINPELRVVMPGVPSSTIGAGK